MTFTAKRFTALQFTEMFFTKKKLLHNTSKHCHCIWLELKSTKKNSACIITVKLRNYYYQSANLSTVAFFVFCWISVLQFSRRSPILPLCHRCTSRKISPSYHSLTRKEPTSLATFVYPSLATLYNIEALKSRDFCLRKSLKNVHF